MTIKILPALLSNQIAAGEVIERPASVVKEVLENALDAGGSQLTIDIEAGGMRKIAIRDNGCGVTRTDLPLTIAPHATSKIFSLDDLFAVGTLGFRGEALASIASVSRFSLRSKCAEACAYQLAVEGMGEAPIITETAHPTGTTVEVRDLFFNTPVRRKFMRSNKTEFAHIETVVRRLAMSRFDVAVVLKHDGKTIFNLPAVDNSDDYSLRVAKLFGRQFLESAKTIDEQADNLRLWGWLGSPAFLRSQNDLQYVYLNGRMIKDKLINHALKQVYAPLLYPGRQATFLLFLTVDVTKVDVNVHPTKHEVRFAEPRHVHDFILSRVGRAVAEFQVDFTAENIAPAHVADSSPSVSLSNGDNTLQTEGARGAPVLTQASYPRSATLSYSAAAKAFHDISATPNGQWLSVSPRYVLIHTEQATRLCDVQALYQRYLSSRLTKAFAQNHALASRPLLVPVSFEFSHSQFESLAIESLEQLGISLSALNDQQVMVRTIPVLAPHISLAPLLNALVGVTEPLSMIQCMVEHTSINYLALSEQDKQAMTALLDEKDNSHPGSQPLSKVLNESDWVRLLNA